MMKEALLGKTITELKEIVKELGFPAFSANQIASWLYQKNINSIDEMTNLSLEQRDKLKERFTYGSYAPSEVITSVDGTKKYLYHVQENYYIETVYIPDKERGTLCVSSQVGCKMNCKFCMTGKQGFRMHLSAQHIINQIISVPEREKLTNIVYMGMGEPMDNLDEVLKSLDILTGKYAFSWSPKRITVSTIGIKKGIHRFMEESNCHLAISLHSPIPTQRKELMPIEKANPVKEILDLLRTYDFSRQRRLSFEYILFKSVNDSEVYAKELVRLLRGLDCRINLINFHQIPGVDLQGVDEQTIASFRDYLTKHGIFTTIRQSRGEDIFAACGMLSTKRLTN